MSKQREGDYLYVAQTLDGSAHGLFLSPERLGQGDEVEINVAAHGQPIRMARVIILMRFQRRPTKPGEKDTDLDMIFDDLVRRLKAQGGLH